MWKSAIVAPPSNMCVLSFMRSRLSAELALERLELPLLVGLDLSASNLGG